MPGRAADVESCNQPKNADSSACHPSLAMPEPRVRNSPLESINGLSDRDGHYYALFIRRRVRTKTRSLPGCQHTLKCFEQGEFIGADVHCWASSGNLSAAATLRESLARVAPLSE